jgi:hypothetical protein
MSWANLFLMSRIACSTAATQHPALVFHLRDPTAHDRHGSPPLNSLPLPQVEFLARLTGTPFPETSFPTGVFGGDTNPWDAADYCRTLINRLSAIPSEAVSTSSGASKATPGWPSYNVYIRHALANQEKRRRDLEYERPDWPSTIKALSNGAPAASHREAPAARKTRGLIPC